MTEEFDIQYRKELVKMKVILETELHTIKTKLKKMGEIDDKKEDIQLGPQ